MNFFSFAVFSWMCLPLCAAMVPSSFPSGHAVPPIEQTAARSVACEGEMARLARVFEKARAGNEVRLLVIGGSITEGARASKQSFRWGETLAADFQKEFPRAKVLFKNVAIGATGSAIGAFRVSRDVTPFKPDLVGVEFSVNDSDVPLSGETMEGLLRQILSAPEQPAVVMLGMMNQSGGNAQQVHLPVARHYGVPYVSYRDALLPDMKAGKFVWSDISPDTIHPNDIGHAYAAALVGACLFGHRQAKLEPVKPLPKPLYGTTFDRGSLIPAADWQMIENRGFTPAKEGQWGMGLQGAKVGDRIAFDVEAPTVALLWRRGKLPFGKARVMVDGKVACTLDGFADQWWWHTPFQLLVRDQPGIHHVVVECIGGRNSRSEGDGFRVCAILTSK